jgi:hypothetical protein
MTMYMKHSVKHYIGMRGHIVQNPKISTKTTTIIIIIIIILTLHEIPQAKIIVIENISKQALWSPQNSITGRNTSVVTQWS